LHLPAEMGGGFTCRQRWVEASPAGRDGWRLHLPAEMGGGFTGALLGPELCCRDAEAFADASGVSSRRRYLFYHSGQEAWLVGKPAPSCDALNGRSQPSPKANQAWADEFAGWHVVSTRTNCRSSTVPKDLGDHLTNSITLTALPPGTFKESAPFVTFVIASKGRDTLQRTLRSLLHQADPSWRAIVCFDDVSAAKQQKLNLPQDSRITIMHTGKKLGTNGNHAAAVRNLAASNNLSRSSNFMVDATETGMQYSDG
ncbi:hypothetical protein CYMTET_27121, partial [Cymbomonas tetramitiformis]